MEAEDSKGEASCHQVLEPEWGFGHEAWAASLGSCLEELHPLFHALLLQSKHSPFFKQKALHLHFALSPTSDESDPAWSWLLAEGGLHRFLAQDLLPSTLSNPTSGL